MNRLIIPLLCLVLISSTPGCRQPVANPPSRQSLFNFNQGGLFAANNRNNGLAGAFGNRQNNIPNLDIQTNSPQQFEMFNNLSTQINDLNQRIGGFDSDNQQLHSEVAGLQQKLQLANDFNRQLRQQLADTSGQLQQLHNEKLSMQQQLAASQNQIRQLNQTAAQGQQVQYNGGGAPTQFAGTATVRANNSLLQKLDQIRIPGGNVRMDGDVIRIELPSDALFVPGSYQIQASQVATLQNVVGTIRQNFPKQIIGIEAHWDGTPLSPANISDHQLTATQSLAIFNEMQKLGLNRQQMFTMALGSNRPRHNPLPNGTNRANRRIEVVVYPEEY